MEPRMSIRVFLVDDHELLRRGVREVLAAESDIEVIGEAATATDALAEVPRAHPDVAVLDLRLPDGDGIELCRELRTKMTELRCLILTSYSTEEALLKAVMAGADGLVSKEVGGQSLIEAIRNVHQGNSMLDAASAARIIEQLRAAQRVDQSLTHQERRILELIGEGLTNRQIGDRLHLAEKTVKNYVSSLLGKLGMQSRTQAALYAARRLAGGSSGASPGP